MRTWQTQLTPHTPHSAPKYWQNVADLVESSNIAPYKVSVRSGPGRAHDNAIPDNPPFDLEITADPIYGTIPN